MRFYLFSFFLESITQKAEGTITTKELRKVSSLVEALNVDNRSKQEACLKLFENIHTMQERNKMILHTIEKEYSQHMIAKVLGLSQQAVYGVINYY